MAGRIDDDVLAALPVEERPCGVNGDALLLLFEKGIEQERVFELLALLAANGLDLFQLAVRQRARVGIEPSKQGGLAVIDVADNHDVEMFGSVGYTGIHLTVTFECDPQARFHHAAVAMEPSSPHMYPSFRNSSMPRPSSCARPARSATVV